MHGIKRLSLRAVASQQNSKSAAQFWRGGDCWQQWPVGECQRQRVVVATADTVATLGNNYLTQKTVDLKKSKRSCFWVRLSELLDKELIAEKLIEGLGVNEKIN